MRRRYIMKKLGIVSLVSLVFLLICSTVAYLLRYSPLDNPWWYLVMGLAALALSGVAAMLGRKIAALNIVCFLTSAAALGACIRAWYIFRGFDNPLWLMALVSVAATVYLTVFFLFSKIPVFARHPAPFVSIFLLISLVGYLVLVLATKTTYVSTFGYYMLIEIAFILAMYAEANSIRELIRTLALSTFSVFGVIVFVAVLIFVGSAGGDCDLDGDCCELCDCADGCGNLDPGTKKKRGDK